MPASNPYDDLVYTGYPYVQTHPDRLATLATFFGMKPMAVERCRVLEIGCGDGANLIPMALGLPRGEFIGIDLAERPIAKGNALAKKIGLENITLRRCNVMDVSDDLGRFDYIIAHGLYSWVPPTAQDKILAVCKANLAPQGVAYVSYNAYPGAHLRQMTREMMLFHARDLADPRERLDQARRLLGSLLASQAESEGYGIFLKQELDRVLARPDEALYHDDLAPVNTPLYFYQFIQHAERHGLQYLSEARLADGAFVGQTGMPTDGDLVAKEQYADFFKCRAFRQTLLCHQDVELNRALDAKKVKTFYIASSARPVVEKPNIAVPGVVEQFRVSTGAMISADHPLAKGALMGMCKLWPQSVDFDRLTRSACALAGRKQENLTEQVTEEESVALCGFLLKLYAADLVELRTYPAAFLTVPSERPAVSPLARLQAQDGFVVTTLRHTSVEVKDGLARHLLALLDGTRDRAALLRDLTGAMQLGDVVTQGDKSRPNDQLPAFNITAEELDQRLCELARLALLVA